MDALIVSLGAWLNTELTRSSSSFFYFPSVLLLHPLLCLSSDVTNIEGMRLISSSSLYGSMMAPHRLRVKSRIHCHHLLLISMNHLSFLHAVQRLWASLQTKLERDGIPLTLKHWAKIAKYCSFDITFLMWTTVTVNYHTHLYNGSDFSLPFTEPLLKQSLSPRAGVGK